MAQSLAWRNFRRMQDLSLVFAILAWLANAILAWELLPGAWELRLAVIVLFPAVYLVGVAAIGMGVRPLREVLKKFVWMSYKAGFGQTAFSVLLSMGILAAVAAYTYIASTKAADGGQYPAGAFSGFGAGIGILIVQTILTHRLQQDPAVRQEVEE